MITKNNNFFIKSLTKNLVNSKIGSSKKPGNTFVRLNSKPHEEQLILPNRSHDQPTMMQIKRQPQTQPEGILQQEPQEQQEQQQQYRLLQQQQQRFLHQEQQRLLQQEQQRVSHQRVQHEQEQQRLLHQEQQRLLQHKQRLLHQEQQRILKQEQQRVLQQQQHQERVLQQEQQRVLQQQQHQERVLKQEQQRVLQQQQHQERVLKQEQQRVLQQQQQQERLLQQQEQQRVLQQEQQRILQQQKQQQAEKIILERQYKQNIPQESLYLPLFGKNKKTVEPRNSVLHPPPLPPSNNNISSFASALSDYKKKKNANKGTLKMDIMNDGNSNVKKMFQTMCLSNVSIIPRHLLQNVVLNRENEAILIEFRVLPHVEFIIKNAIIKLGDTFSHTIVCGNANYSMMKKICEDISPEIKIIKLEKNNITINEYNNLFYDLSFWEMFCGNKLLFYQEDTIIFKNNIHEFLQYDYVGAPWDLVKNPTFPNVGNGGFSLRNRNMLMGILRDGVNMRNYDHINKKHKSGNILENIPEDLFFSLNLLKLNIGNIPDAHRASYFSTEIIVNKDSLGGHQFWMNDRSWMDRMNALFQEYRTN